MKVLVFDTETTGLPAKGMTIKDPAYPLPLQVAAMLVEDETDYVFHSFNYLLYWHNVGIHPKAEAVHGISQRMIEDLGLSPKGILNTLREISLAADLFIAHNLKFDDDILQSAWARAGLAHKAVVMDQTSWRGPGGTLYDTMLEATPICKLPGRRGEYKWPKLTEAYEILVDPRGFKGAHDAMADVQACYKLYKALKCYKKPPLTA